MKKYILACFLSLTLVGSTQAQWLNNIDVFSIDDDIKLGKQLQDEIAKDPKNYPILDEKKYPEAYAHIRRIRDKILNSGQLTYKDKFEWDVHIIHKDSVLNAFVSPGGHIYVYTGLIKYLDHEDELAGVLGHEIAHADRRHSTRNMTKQYGFSTILGILLGNKNSQVKQVLGGLTGNLVGLKFSREFEAEADAYSVEYLAKTEYQCNGTAGFFVKLLASGNNQAPPQFLSTHPSSQNRVQDINAKAKSLGCNTQLSKNNYDLVKKSLP